jgi:hypothetical protein
MSGGGVLTMVAAGARAGSLAPSGGGTAIVDGSSGESHSGSVAAAGGGSALLEAWADRLSEIAATGHGSLTWAAWGAHAGSAVARGRGHAVVDREAPIVAPPGIGFATDFGPISRLPRAAVRAQTSYASQAGIDRPDWDDPELDDAR